MSKVPLDQTLLLKGFKVYADISNVLGLLKDLDGEDGYHSSNIVKDKTGPGRKVAFVNYQSAADAARALTNLQDYAAQLEKGAGKKYAFLEGFAASCKDKKVSLNSKKDSARPSGSAPTSAAATLPVPKKKEGSVSVSTSRGSPFVLPAFDAYDSGSDSEDEVLPLVRHLEALLLAKEPPYIHASQVGSIVKKHEDWQDEVDDAGGVKCFVQDHAGKLEWYQAEGSNFIRLAASSKLKVGDQVCISGEPSTGWGGVHRWSVGTILKVSVAKVFVVDFPENNSWKGYTKDLDLAKEGGRATASSGTPHPTIGKFGFVKFSGLKVEFTGAAESVTTHHREYGFVRGKSKLSKERPYVEMTIVVDRADGIGLGVCGDDVYAGAMPGWPSYPSIGYHSDDGGLFYQEYAGRGLDFGGTCHAGDRMGVGALFSAGGVAETVVFTRNGELAGWAPITEPDMLYVVAAATAPAVVTLNFEASLPRLLPAAWLQTQGGSPEDATAFSNLALAVAAATDGDKFEIT